MVVIEVFRITSKKFKGGRRWAVWGNRSTFRRYITEFSPSEGEGEKALCKSYRFRIRKGEKKPQLP